MVADFFAFVNFEWHCQNEVGNVSILVVLRVCGKLQLQHVSMWEEYLNLDPYLQTFVSFITLVWKHLAIYRSSIQWYSGGWPLKIPQSLNQYPIEYIDHVLSPLGNAHHIALNPNRTLQIEINCDNNIMVCGIEQTKCRVTNVFHHNGNMLGAVQMGNSMHLPLTLCF